jgi:competence ComEA-like helix-hairpin-helix protein
VTDRPLDRIGVPPPVPCGWGALLLAVALAGWGAVPLLRVGGPDLAALRPPAREAPGGAGAGGSSVPPRRPPPRPGDRAGREKVVPAARLDLNRATPADLAALPGIGPALAARIVEYRQAVGPFPRVEALRGVPGIGPKRYERIAPHLLAGERDRP